MPLTLAHLMVKEVRLPEHFHRRPAFQPSKVSTFKKSLKNSGNERFYFILISSLEAYKCYRLDANNYCL